MGPRKVEDDTNHPRARRSGGGAVAGLLFFTAVAASALPFACGGAPKRPPVAAEVALDGGPLDGADVAVAPPPPPLYTRLGGKDGVAAIVDSFIDDLQADPRLKKAFAKTKKGPKLDHFKQMLNDQICQMTGGGCQYTGAAMTDEHAKMKVTEVQFTAFVADFQLALEEKQVSKDDMTEFLGHLNEMHDQIVAGAAPAK